MFSVDQHDWLVLWQQSNPNTLSCASLGSCSKQLTHFFQRAISLLWMWDLLAFWDRRCHPVSLPFTVMLVPGVSQFAGRGQSPCASTRNRDEISKVMGRLGFVCVVLFLFLWELFVVVPVGFCLVFFICLFGICFVSFERAAGLSWFPTEKQAPPARMLWMTTRKPELHTSVSLISH